MATAKLLEKLDPESMMQEDGLKKAHLSLVLLLKQANEGPLAAEVAAVAGGTRILVQTCVLHPVPELRQQATAVLGACIKEAVPAFLASALENRIPAALLRLLREEDRRAKQEGFDKAVDPDLPIRRVAIVALTDLLLSTDGATQQAVLDDPTTLTVVLIACGNNDAEVSDAGCPTRNATSAPAHHLKLWYITL